MPLAPQPRVEAHALEAVRGRGELGLKGLAAKLAIGDDGTAGGLLELDNVPYGPVLDRLQPGVVDAAGGEGPASLDQLGRAKQASYVFGARVDKGAPARRTQKVLGPIRLP